MREPERLRDPRFGIDLVGLDEAVDPRLDRGARFEGHGGRDSLELGADVRKRRIGMVAARPTAPKTGAATKAIAHKPATHKPATRPAANPAKAGSDEGDWAEF